MAGVSKTLHEIDNIKIDKPIYFMYIFMVDTDKIERRFRWESIDDHLAALQCGPMGKNIYEFCQKAKIYVEENSDLPERTLAQYRHSHGVIGSLGTIQYNETTNAAILAHEARHAWQHTLPRFVTRPSNPADYVIKQRFMEADARAFEMGIIIEIMANMSVHHGYAEQLRDVLQPHEKEILDSENINELLDSKPKMMQVMRRTFDQWMYLGLTSDYDGQIEDQLKASQGRGIVAKAFSFAGPIPKFSKGEPDPNYSMALAKELGRLDDDTDANYLLDTDGPELNSELYTRISNIKLERLVTKIQGQRLTA
jgi:uncharacterized phage-associated protein